MKNAKREVKVLGLVDLGLRSEDTGEQASLTKLEKLFIPEIAKKMEILTGSPSEASGKL